MHSWYLRVLLQYVGRKSDGLSLTLQPGIALVVRLLLDEYRMPFMLIIGRGQIAHIPRQLFPQRPVSLRHKRFAILDCTIDCLTRQQRATASEISGQQVPQFRLLLRTLALLASGLLSLGRWLFSRANR